jgi:Protein of unknown function (DUF2442)
VLTKINDGSVLEARTIKLKEVKIDFQNEFTLLLTLDVGIQISVPVRLLEHLEKVDLHYQNFNISDSKGSIEFPDLGLEVGLEQLLAGIYGSKAWMKQLKEKL